MQQFFKKMLLWTESLFPYRCLACELPAKVERDLCLACEKELPRILSGCARCQVELPPGAHSRYCADCLFGKHAVHTITALYDYASPVSNWVIALKSRRFYHIGRLLAELLAEEIMVRQQKQPEPLPMLLIPVPLTPLRLKQRGFNQAHLIAQFLGEILNIPVALNAAIKIQDRMKQAQLKAEARQKNVENIFAIVEPLPEHVCIVDDVITTASTVESLAKICLQHGAKRVDVYAPCRRQKK